MTPRLPRLPRPRLPRRVVSDVIDLTGVGCLVGAAWWWQPIVGLVASGLALLLIGWVLDQ